MTKRRMNPHELILDACTTGPYRMAITEMRDGPLGDLREAGLVECAPELTNVIAAKFSHGIAVVGGSPTPFVWVALTAKGLVVANGLQAREFRIKEARVALPCVQIDESVHADLPKVSYFEMDLTHSSRLKSEAQTIGPLKLTSITYGEDDSA